MRTVLEIIAAAWRGLFKRDPAQEVKDEAKKRTDSVDDGSAMSDRLNEQLRDK